MQKIAYPFIVVREIYKKTEKVIIFVIGPKLEAKVLNESNR